MTIEPYTQEANWFRLVGVDGSVMESEGNVEWVGVGGVGAVGREDEELKLVEE